MNDVHPTAVIGPDVVLGRGNVVGPYAVILGPVTVGDDNWIGPHVVIGTQAEIRGIDHGPSAGGVGTGVRLGSGNVVREHATIHQGHYATTVIGDRCYLMNRVYIGHDGHIADDVTMASSVTLGGHVHVGRAANFGMGAIVHQRRVVGPLAMVGMAAVLTRDVPPFATAYGNPCRVRSANRVGMRRAGFPDAAIESVDAAYAAGKDVSRGDMAAGAEWAAAWDWWDAETAR